MAEAATKAVQGVRRTVAVALASYDTVAGTRDYATMGQDVLVHPESVARFDELNRPPRFTPDPEAERGGHVDVNRRPPTAAEQRIVDGFGNGAITVDAQNMALADAERQADAKR